MKTIKHFITITVLLLVSGCDDIPIDVKPEFVNRGMILCEANGGLDFMRLPRGRDTSSPNARFYPRKFVFNCKNGAQFTKFYKDFQNA